MSSVAITVAPESPELAVREVGVVDLERVVTVTTGDMRVDARGQVGDGDVVVATAAVDVGVVDERRDEAVGLPAGVDHPVAEPVAVAVVPLDHTDVNLVGAGGAGDGEGERS